MDFNEVIPFESYNGHKFLIKFDVFKSQLDFNIPVINVSLLLVESSANKITLKDLLQIAKIIRDYLLLNKVVLYYYCDINGDDIFRSVRHLNMLPQAFRNQLFGKLFDFMKVTTFIKDEIIIEDEANETAHYISLITKVEDKIYLTEIGTEVLKMNDK